MSKEAMKLALEALEEAWYHVGTFQPTEKAIDLYDEARTALREALAEQPAQRKPLTDEEIEALLPEPDGTAEVDSVRVLVAPGLYGTEYSEADAWTKESVIQVARAIEAAHNIKENT